MQTFKDIRDSVMALFDVIGDTGTDQTVTDGAINRANAMRVGEANWAWALLPKASLSVVSGTQKYILPQEQLGRLAYVYNTTDKVWLEVVTQRSLIDMELDATGQTDNQRVLIGEYSPVKAQPASADTLTVTSSTVEDGSQTLYIEGEDSSGDFISESVLSTGTTSQSFRRVTYVAKVGTWAGTLTLATTGGTTLLTLGPTQFARQYPVLEFVGVPNRSFTATYRGYKRPRIMTRDYDLPDVPYPASDILVYDALLELATYNELDSESINIWREKQRAILDNMYLETMPGNTVGGRTERLFEGF